MTSHIAGSIAGSIADSIGANRTVLALSMARLGDAVGNSILFIVTIGFGLGIALGPLITSVLATVVFEVPFIIGGALTIVGAWIVFRYVPETIRRSEFSAAEVQRKALPTEGD